MKEKIYTIPVNESFEQNTECPFCFLEKKLEQDALDYALGPALMESDYRILSNEKGYCNKHFSMLLAKPQKLGLSLICETHLEEVINKIKAHEDTLNSLKRNNKGFFKKSTFSSPEKALAHELNSISKSCLICDNIKSNMERYLDVFFYMWEKDSEFRKKVSSSKGFCLKHFSYILENSHSKLKKPEEFVSTVYNLELENLRRIGDEIHKFILKFDYRNKDLELGSAVDSTPRCIEKLAGYIAAVKEETN